MKRIKAYFYKSIVISFFLPIGLVGYGQGKQIQKTYSWKYKVNKDVRFTFNNYDCDLIIHTWDKPEIEYRMAVDATLKTEEEANRLDEYIEDLEFTHSAGSIEFDNRFWQSKKNIIGKKTIGLKGEKTVRYSDFDMEGELWIPVNSNLNLKSKYSGIEIEDTYGRISLDLYNDKLFGGNVNENIRIEAKYSTLEFKEMKDIEANLYNTDIEAGEIGNLKINSKYSKFKSDNAGKLDITAYNDKYTFGNTEDIKFVDKYSDLTAGLSGNIEMDCYNSTVIITSVESTDLKSKYSKYEISKADNLNISSSYNDSYKIFSLKTLNINETKYGTYKVDELNSSLFVGDCYSDKYMVLKTPIEFSGVKVTGKYADIQIGIDVNLDYRFKANVKYPKFDINEEAMDVRVKIKESSQIEMDAIRGTEKNRMPEFIINGYDMSLTFTELH